MVGDLFSESECNDIVHVGERDLRLEAGRVDSQQIQQGIRSSEVGWFGPQGELKWVFDRLRDCLNAVNGDWFRYELIGFEGLQFTKYSARERQSDYYASHVDLKATELGTIRKLSFTVQLSPSDSYAGGDVLIYETLQKSVAFSRKIGSITFFPSYALHEVVPVTSGVRYSLVGWAHGAPFR